MKIKMIVLFFVFVLSLSATIINIPADQPTIQDGINISVHGDTILVQPGTYYENINYNGKKITVASLFLTIQDTSYISQTVIDGNQNGSVVTFESEEEIDILTLLCGFTITNGFADNGGGINITNSSPTISNCRIFENNLSTFGYGEAIYSIYSNPIIKHNIINLNDSSTMTYGIICVEVDSMQISNNRFIDEGIMFFGRISNTTI